MFFKLFILVILVQSSVGVVVKKWGNKTRFSLIWDYADIDDSETSTTTTLLPTKVVNRPPPKKPSFEQLGRRISRVKCQEYIWDLKQMERQMKSDRTKYYKLFREKRRDILDAAKIGKYSLPGEYPHMVAVGWVGVNQYVYKCGGSLISSNFVLTAGHCTKAPKSVDGVEDPVPKVVRLGDPNIGDEAIEGFGPLIINISQIHRHPDHVPPQMYNDIALLEIPEVKFSFLVHPACLWEFEVRNLAQHAIIAGWGVVETATRNTSSELQSAEVDIINYYDCDDLLRPFCGHRWCGLQASQLCAGKLKGGVDTCQGDSGGPLQVRLVQRQARLMMYYVIGVTSFGVGCGRPNAPGVYTRVSSYIDWIEKTVWGEKTA